MEARDRAAVVSAFAEDAVLRSPFTPSLVFTGRDELGDASSTCCSTRWRTSATATS